MSTGFKKAGLNNSGMKTLIITILLILAFPGVTTTACNPVFDSLADQFRFHKIRLYHGECAVSTDFTVAIRADGKRAGERIRLR